MVMMKQVNIIHYPNLKTILMIEEALKSSNKPITREQLKSKIPRKIMHQTLNIALQYLEDSGKIFDGRKGIVWIHNPSRKLAKAISKGIEV